LLGTYILGQPRIFSPTGYVLMVIYRIYDYNIYLLRSCQGFLRKSREFFTHNYLIFSERGAGLVPAHKLPNLSGVYCLRDLWQRINGLLSLRRMPRLC
jgi:hypothetical protein